MIIFRGVYVLITEWQILSCLRTERALIQGVDFHLLSGNIDDEYVDWQKINHSSFLRGSEENSRQEKVQFLLPIHDDATPHSELQV